MHAGTGDTAAMIGPRPAHARTQPAHVKTGPFKGAPCPALPKRSAVFGRVPVLCAHLPTTMGFFQPGTRRGILSITIGSRNTVPLRMLRIVPLGLFHICGAEQAEQSQQIAHSQGASRGRTGRSCGQSRTWASTALAGTCQLQAASRAPAHPLIASGSGFHPHTLSGPAPRRPLCPAHLLQAKLLDTRFIGGDGGALDAHVVLLQNSKVNKAVGFWRISSLRLWLARKPQGRHRPNADWQGMMAASLRAPGSALWLLPHRHGRHSSSYADQQASRGG